MVFTWGSGSSGPEKQGTSDDEICRIIAAKVVVAVWEAIPKVFGSIKTVMIVMFDERYAAVTEAAAATATTAIVGARPNRVD